jgi:arylsulfatase A-like enzyme
VSALQQNLFIDTSQYNLHAWESDMPNLSRKEFLATSITGAAAAALPGSQAQAATRPNVLFIFCDQLRYSALGSSGNTMVQTPNLDEFAKQGVVFDNAVSGCPICSPYRAQIVTGRYSHKNGVVCNEYALADNQTTMPQAFKQAGYRTGFIGKIHLGEGPYPESKRHGFDYMFANNCEHNYYNVTYYENEEGPIQTTDWSPEVETKKAIEFMSEQTKKSPDQPFSLMLGYGPPHNSYGGPGHSRYDLYPGNYNIYDPAAIELRPNVPVPLQDHARNEIADYYAMVTGLDDMMGRIMKALDRLGIADNTIVCFSSDHGDHLMSHGYIGPWSRWLHHTMRACKATPYEESAHIPFLMRYPDGVKAGQRTPTHFGSVDVMPTLLGLCGVKIPDGVQGTDCSHAVTGGSGDTPDSTYLQLLGPGWPYRGDWVGYWRAVRGDRYTYARWYQPEKYEEGIWLFDRDKDPYEMQNLAGKPAAKQLQNRMEDRLQQWMQDTDDPFDTGERDPETHMLQLGQKFSNAKWVR